MTTAILITSFDGHKDVLCHSVESALRATPAVVVSYNVVDRLPDPEVVHACPVFVAGGKNRGRQAGELDNMHRGLLAVKAMYPEARYILKMTGRDIIGRPDGVAKLAPVYERQGAGLLTPQSRGGSASTMLQFGHATIMRVIWLAVSSAEPSVEDAFAAELVRRGTKVDIRPLLSQNSGFWGKTIGFWRVGGTPLRPPQKPIRQFPGTDRPVQQHRRRRRP